MIRLRAWSALAVALLLTNALQAQDKPARPWIVDRTLTVSPQLAPVPSLKYRLLPLDSDLREGNPVPIYLRLAHEQNDAAQKYLAEAPMPWNQMPVDQIPHDEALKFIQRWHYTLRQLDAGARRRRADWNYTMELGDPIGMLIPDAQQMRKYAPAMVLQVRMALAEGDFAAAVHHLQTGFAVSRHITEGPFFIHSMVAFALAAQFINTVADFTERPDAPNLYWALTALPRPLIDLRHALGVEYRMLEMEFPELDDLDRQRSVEQWDALLRRIRTVIQGLAREGRPPKLPDWYQPFWAPDVPAAQSPDLAVARKFVARSKRLTAEQAEALPPAQVLILFLMDTYHKYRDEMYRTFYLPYPEARLLLDAADKRLHAMPDSEGHALARSFLPALNRVRSVQTRIERSLAALRVIEALRIYAAGHDGQLPDKLSDVTEVPLPNDPGTGRPFEYLRENDTATLVSQVPGDPLPNNGVRYRVTIRKK
jgi:hypothetical protein